MKTVKSEKNKQMSKFISKFWNKVLKCKHKNLNPNYLQFIPCGTPYCSGNEVHCMDCGVYISECGCGYNNGMSGWSYKRHLVQERKKYGKNAP